MNLPPLLPTAPGQTPLAVVVLLVVLLIGVAAGRAKSRLVLLLGGLLALLVVGVVLTTVSGVPLDDRPAWVGTLLPTVVPLLVAFLAGWLCGRAGWFVRIVIVGAAVLVLAAFPYAAVTDAAARLLAGG